MIFVKSKKMKQNIGYKLHSKFITKSEPILMNRQHLITKILFWICGYCYKFVEL